MSAQRSWFEALAERTAKAAGHPATFGFMCIVILVWFLSGPWFRWSDTWQLFINTGTTIITFLMVFLLQNSQNRGYKALSIKLDELVRATESARNEVIGLEEKTEVEIAAAADEIRTAVKPKRKKGK